MEDAGIYTKDEKFLLELEQIVLANLDNEQFGVEVLAGLKGISRSHLHRKLKRLKRKSVSQFIRETRLMEAMKLLQQDAANVSEIAYRVGFSSTTYFNTCFHAFYGYPPGRVKKGDFPQNKQDQNPLSTSKNSQQTFKDISEKGTTAAPLLKPASRKRPYLNQAIIFPAIMTLALLFILIYYYNIRSDVPTAQPRAIAILPLDHLSNNTEQEYLTAGIHDALIGELGAISGIRVISKTSTLKYPESNMSIQQIAEELGVDAVVEGSVFISGDSLRLQLQLIDVFPQEQHIWAQNYHRGINNILSIQSNAIEDIANTIQIRLSADEKMHLASVKNGNPETYKAYLRGIYYLNKSTPEEFQKGLDYLHKAIEYDPANPLAYAGLAEGYLTLGHGPDPNNTYWQRGRAAALRAIELDSTLASGFAVLGAIKLYYEGDWEGAKNNFIKANDINPNLGWTHFHYAWYHVLMGQMDQALIEQKLAQQLDPLTPIITADLGSLYHFMGRDDEALIELNRALELDKDYGHAWWVLGNVYLRKGLTDRAIEAHSRAVEINLVWKWALANTYVLAGEEDKALTLVSEIKQNPITPRNAFGLIQVYTSLGDIDNAFYWLQFQPHDVWIPWIRTWPGFEMLRRDPRFLKFLKAKGLPPVTPIAT